MTEPMDIDEPPSDTVSSASTSNKPKVNAMAALMAGAKGKAKEDALNANLSQAQQKILDAREGLPWWVGFVWLDWVLDSPQGYRLFGG